MPRITDTVTDDNDGPVPFAEVVIDVLISEQTEPVGSATGSPERRRVVWHGVADAVGMWVAELPAQSRWGTETFYTASVRHHGRGLSARDEFIVAEDAGGGSIQKVHDRPVPGRERRPRPSNPERPTPIST